jgi:hypothetical protein
MTLPGKRRIEQDREDLLAEATALVERIELATDGDPSIVVGFRKVGAGSLYFGPEPAYHFNSIDQLRRAYVGGLLFKAEKGLLISLDRRRTEGQVQLVRDSLDEQQTADFLAEFARRKNELKAAIRDGRCQIIGQVPADGDVLRRVADWLATLADCPAIASSPHVR